MASPNENFADGVDAALWLRGCTVKSIFTGDEKRDCVIVTAETEAGEKVEVVSSSKEIRMNSDNKKAFIALVRHRVNAVFKQVA